MEQFASIYVLGINRRIRRRKALRVGNRSGDGTSVALAVSGEREQEQAATALTYARRILPALGLLFFLWSQFPSSLPGFRRTQSENGQDFVSERTRWYSIIGRRGRIRSC